MKKTLIIAASFALTQIVFSQGSTTVKGNDKQAKLGVNQHHMMKSNPDYLKGRGPVSSPHQTVTPMARPKSQIVTASSSAAPKQASVGSPQASNKSNDQRIADMNARNAQNKARLDANKASVQVTPAKPAGVPSNFKKPAPLNGAAATKPATIKQSK